MKIFILTLHNYPNFGANLQTFSIYNYFSKRGHEVKLINYIDPQRISNYKSLCPGLQYNAHLNFIDEYIPIKTKEVYSLNEVSQIILEEKPDIVSVGSDAVWRQMKDKELSVFWLNDKRLENCQTKFVSFSASTMGTDFMSFPINIKTEIKQTLQKFSYISLRDQWSILQFKKLGFNATFNPDPVFLLKNTDFKAQDYNSSLPKNLFSRKYIVVSISKQRLNDKWFYNLKKKVNNDGYELLELAMPEGNHGSDCDIRIEHPLSPADWYQCISHAKGYIGERFHASVVCISNHVPFVIIDTYGTKLPSFRNSKSKIYDLMCRIKKNSYIIHKRNPLLYSSNYVYGKLIKHINEEKNKVEFTNVKQLKNIVSSFVDNII